MANVVDTQNLTPEFVRRNLDRCGDYAAAFRTGAVLDRGTFGIIFAVSSATKGGPALDSIVKTTLIRSRQDRDEFEMEKRVLEKCRQMVDPIVPYLNFHGTCQIGVAPGGNPVYLGMIVMERFDKSYYALVNENIRTRPVAEAQVQLQTMLDSGLRLLREFHRRGFVHLDAKHTNFLRKTRDGVVSDVIADFGRTRVVNSNQVELFPGDRAAQFATRDTQFDPMVDQGYLLFSLNTAARYRRMRENARHGRRETFERLKMPTTRQQRGYVRMLVNVRENPINFQWIGMKKETLGGPSVWAEFATAVFDLVSQDFFVAQ